MNQTIQNPRRFSILAHMRRDFTASDSIAEFAEKRRVARRPCASPPPLRFIPCWKDGRNHVVITLRRDDPPTSRARTTRNERGARPESPMRSPYSPIPSIHFTPANRFRQGPKALRFPDVANWKARRRPAREIEVRLRNQSPGYTATARRARRPQPFLPDESSRGPDQRDGPYSL
jgi:hypothetical protein